VGLWNFAFAIVATALVFAQAATHRNCPFPTEERVASLIGWNPVWSMYTNLPKYAYSTSTEATLQDGSTVDLINSEVSTSERSRVQRFHQSYRIRYFLQHASGTWEGFHTRYLAQLVYLWNQCHPPEKMVVRARILGTSKQIRTSEPYKTEVLLDIGFSQVPEDEE
jgi:hypothetical protein